MYPGACVMWVDPVLHILGLLHVWEAERRDRWFGRASRELDVPLTVACGLAMTAHPDSCTRAPCAGAGIQVRRQSEQSANARA